MKNEIHSLAPQVRAGLRAHALSLNQWLLAEKIVDLTLDRGRLKVLIRCRDEFVWLTHIHRSEITVALNKLEEYGIIERTPASDYESRKFQDPVWIWLKADVAQWRGVQPRVDREWAARVEREIDFVNTPAQEPDGQQKLNVAGEEIAPARTPGFTAEIAQNSAEEALRAKIHEEALKAGFVSPTLVGGADVIAGNPGSVHSLRATDSTSPMSSGKPTTSRGDVVGNADDVGPKTADVVGKTDDVARSSGIPTTSPPYRRAGAPEEHEHVPEHVSPTESMLHEHAPVAAKGKPRPPGGLERKSLAELEALMDDEQRYELGRAMEVTGDKLGSYRKLWALYLLENKAAAVQALGETAHNQKIGFRFRKGAGAFAGDVFKRLRDAGKILHSILW